MRRLLIVNEVKKLNESEVSLDGIILRKDPADTYAFATTNPYLKIRRTDDIYNQDNFTCDFLSSIQANVESFAIEIWSKLPTLFSERNDTISGAFSRVGDDLVVACRNSDADWFKMLVEEDNQSCEIVLERDFYRTDENHMSEINFNEMSQLVVKGLFSVPSTFDSCAVEAKAEVLFDTYHDTESSRPWQEDRFNDEKVRNKVSNHLYECPNFAKFFRFLKKQFEVDLCVNRGKGGHKCLSLGPNLYPLGAKVRQGKNPLRQAIGISALESLKIPLSDFLEKIEAKGW